MIAGDYARLVLAMGLALVVFLAWAGLFGAFLAWTLTATASPAWPAVGAILAFLTFPAAGRLMAEIMDRLAP